jgi:hypothetical protein
MARWVASSKSFRFATAARNSNPRPKTWDIAAQLDEGEITGCCVAGSMKGGGVKVAENRHGRRIVLDCQPSRLVVLRHYELDADPNARKRLTDGHQNDLPDPPDFVGLRPKATPD